jgi:hypothetical protein
MQAFAVYDRKCVKKETGAPNKKGLARRARPFQLFRLDLAFWQKVRDVLEYKTPETKRRLDRTIED